MGRFLEKVAKRNLIVIVSVFFYLLVSDLLYVKITAYYKWANSFLGTLVYGFVLFGYSAYQIYYLIRHRKDTAKAHIYLILVSLLALIIPTIYGLFRGSENLTLLDNVLLYTFPVATLFGGIVTFFKGGKNV